MSSSLKLKILSLCIIGSMIANTGLQTANAAGEFKELTGNTVLSSDVSLNQTENIDFTQLEVEYQPNDYVEDTYRLIVKYIDSEGEKVDVENKIIINSYMETVIVSSDIDMESYIGELKSLNNNIDYVQPDYKLILSEASVGLDISEEAVSPTENISKETVQTETEGMSSEQSAQAVNEDIVQKEESQSKTQTDAQEETEQSTDIETAQEGTEQSTDIETVQEETEQPEPAEQENETKQDVSQEQTEEPDRVYNETLPQETPNSNEDEGVVVAVVDTGIYTAHEALNGKIWTNNNETADETDSDGNGFIDDVSGWDFVNNTPMAYDESKIVDYSHGTHIAGIISGEGDKIDGIHSDAKIMPLKAFENGSAYTTDVIRAIEYADAMGADIVNCSFGSNDENRALKDTMSKADMIFVCAAGNDNADVKTQPFYPALYDMDNVISVSAANENGDIAFFSNYGEDIDLSAPGCSIKSTVPENEYGNSSGTSAAAAYISGTIANEISVKATSTQNLINTVSESMRVKEESIENDSDIVDTALAEWHTGALPYALSRASVEMADMLSSTVINPRPIEQIAAGGYHSTVLVDGRVYSFGTNDHNQVSGNTVFGDGDAVAPGNEILENVSKISTRGDHNLVLMDDGTVRSWGANSYGELGRGYAGGEGITDAYTVTEQVVGLSNIVDISAGHQFSLALDSNGRIYAWGNNKEGQLGINNTYTFFTTPQLVGSLTDVAQISAGHYHALALTGTGKVYGWGRGSNAALFGLTNNKYYAPTQLDITGVDKVFAGRDNSFFITSDGDLKGCGFNDYGQLGNGNVSKTSSLVTMSVNNAVDVSSNNTTLILTSDGKAYGCGASYFGQLGTGTTANAVRNITSIPGTYTAVSSGGSHSLFLKGDGVYASGRNHKSQCGTSDTGINYTTPTLISSFARNAFNVTDVQVNLQSNKVLITGNCSFDGVKAKVAVTDRNNQEYIDVSSDIIVNEDGTYTFEFTPQKPKNGINRGYIKLVGYPYTVDFSFNYDTSLATLTDERTISVQTGNKYILAVSVADVEDISDKVFTVTFDSSKLSLDDVCAQTWTKEKSVGAVNDTDVQITSVSGNQIKFKVNKPQNITSGCINLIGFNVVTAGNATVGVSAVVE